MSVHKKGFTKASAVMKVKVFLLVLPTPLEEINTPLLRFRSGSWMHLRPMMACALHVGSDDFPSFMVRVSGLVPTVDMNSVPKAEKNVCG